MYAQLTVKLQLCENLLIPKHHLHGDEHRFTIYTCLCMNNNHKRINGKDAQHVPSHVVWCECVARKHYGIIQQKIIMRQQTLYNKLAQEGGSDLFTLYKNKAKRKHGQFYHE